MSLILPSIGAFGHTAAAGTTDRAIVIPGSIPGGLQATVGAVTLPVTVYGWYWMNSGATGTPTIWASNTGAEQIWATPTAIYGRAGSGSAVGIASGASGTEEWVPFRVTFASGAPYVTVQSISTSSTGSSAVTEITSSGTHWVGQDDGGDLDFPGRVFDIGLKSGTHTLTQLNYVDNGGTPNWTDFSDGTPNSYEYRLRGQNTGAVGEDSLGQNDFSQSSGGGDATLDAANVPAGANP